MSEHKPSDFVIGFLAWLALGGLVAGWTGCASTPDPATLPVRTNAITHAALFVGVSKGYAGACPGSDIDAQTMKTWIRDNREVTVLIDKKATLAAVQAALLDANRRLPDDGSGLMTVGFAGHGTLRNRKVDIAKYGVKEGGLCFYDQVWWASDLAAWVTANFKPCRIEFLPADCCHAENNWRAFGEAVTFGFIDNPRGPVVIRLDAPQGWKGQMVQFAGCRQLSYSYGDANAGGTWTQTLDFVIKFSKQPISRLHLYTESAALMPLEQEPAWTTYNASSNFVNGIVFQ